MEEIDKYFLRLRENEEGIYTAGYEKYDKFLSPFKCGLYIVQKSLRFTTY
ncbi:hypothetical protein [Alkalicoccus halolimnae]|uniref:Uncharacterized protein n=1 Tax=Alkalicoccus halolimnae TaxID=1667239 RepID=A0AAJ8N229_9BACI|nr:hypothetical protein [Alkalicoccus halolimnae]